MASAPMEQRSADWFATRCGKVTASRIGDLMAKTKTGLGATRANYHAQLVAERLTQSVEQGFSNAAMQWGVEQEANARTCYEFDRGVTVQEIAFIDHPKIVMSGASPDGIIGLDGMVEIKCPGTAKHINTLTGAAIDGGYIKQMQWQMACAGRQWCDFVSYDPRLPVEMQLHVRRVERDDEFISEMEAAVRDFLAEVDATVATLTDLYQKAA
jgi:putative phage-type endonuclease